LSGDDDRLLGARREEVPRFDGHCRQLHRSYSSRLLFARIVRNPRKDNSGQQGGRIGGQRKSPSTLNSIHGSVDRVTGDLEATLAVSEPKTSKIYSKTIYALKCRPTQGMF